MDGGGGGGGRIAFSDKIDFMKRVIKSDPEGDFLILKGRIHQAVINFINIYAPNIGAPKHLKKILEDFKKDIDNNTVIVRTLTPHYQKWTDIPNKISTRILCH